MSSMYSINVKKQEKLVLPCYCQSPIVAILINYSRLRTANSNVPILLNIG